MSVPMTLNSARHRRRPSWAAVASVLLLGALAAAPRPALADANPADLAPKRVLILQSFGSDFAPYTILSSSFRFELTRILGAPVEFDEVSVTLVSSTDPTMEAALVTYLGALVAAGEPDLVVTIGGQAGRFVQAHRGSFSPMTPVLFAALDERLLPPGPLPAGDVAVPVAHNLQLLVENILQVLPATETVAVMVGSSPLERFWRAEMGREFRAFEDRVDFLWWGELSAHEVLRRAADLPPRSAILYTLYLVDGTGVSHADQRILRSLSGAASAPIFGIFDSQLGEGIVGGSLMPISEVSRRSAEAAAGILRGEPPAGDRLPAMEPGAPVYDGRELERWGISERGLPPGSTVRFRRPSAWSLFRWPILGGLGLILVLTTLVVALNLHRVRLSAAERAVRGLSHRLLTAIEEERRRLGRELHDDVSQRLAGLAIDAARIERELQSAPARAAELRALREEIVALSADLHALSRLLHPSVLDDLGLVEALRAEADRFTRMESISVELQLEEPEPRLSEDSALCLYRIAQEALRNVARHAAAATVAISLRATNGGCELEVRDDGVGFEFERRRGRGLGLASMHERAQLVGGRLAVTSAPQRGSSVVAWVPLGCGEAA